MHYYVINNPDALYSRAGKCIKYYSWGQTCTSAQDILSLNFSPYLLNPASLIIFINIRPARVLPWHPSGSSMRSIRAWTRSTSARCSPCWWRAHAAPTHPRCVTGKWLVGQYWCNRCVHTCPLFSLPIILVKNDLLTILEVNKGFGMKYFIATGHVLCLLPLLLISIYSAS